MTIAHGSVVRRSNKAVSKLENLELSLLSQATKSTRAQIGYAVKVASHKVGNLALTLNNVLTHSGSSLYPRLLLLHRGGVKDQG